MLLNQKSMEQYSIPPGPVEQYNSAEELLHWLKRNCEDYGKIYKASVYGSNVYVVCDPQYCEYVLRRNWQNYPRKGLVVQRIGLALGNNLITSNGESWARQRRMIQPAFTKSAIGRLNNMIAGVNVELLDEWKEAARLGKTVNVTKDVSLMVLKITLMSIFGDDYESVAPHFKFFAEEAGRDLGFAQALPPLRKLVLQIVAQRRGEQDLGGRSPPMDTLDVMIQARDRDGGMPMPDPQLAREVLNLVVAGHETTASLLNWMWRLLATHPDAQTRLEMEFDRLPWDGHPMVEELPKYAYARGVIDEALRLYPPLWLMTRKALNDDRLGEYFVPAGTEIYISPYLIQRSPHLWEAPDMFDPDRLASENEVDRHELALCPFGAGPRKCIGDFLARVEIQMHLMMFGRELWLRPSETRPSPPEITTGVNLLSKHDFNMLPEIKAPPTRSA